MSAPEPAMAEPGSCLVRGLALVRASQLGTGEIAAFQPSGREVLLCPDPLPSAYVHDALAWLDPRSRRAAGAELLVPRQARAWFLRTVRAVRARVRAYLAWQERADGTWCAHGRGGAGPDPGLTACAAAVLLGEDGPARRRHVRALATLPAGDPVAACHVLRFLALAGADPGELPGRLRQEIAASGSQVPILFLHAAARAWGQGGLPGAAEVARALVPRLLALQGDDGGFGGPLATALAVHALLDLGHDGPALERAGDRLRAAASGLDGRGVRGGGGEPFGRQGSRSPALAAALARGAVAWGRRPA